MNGNSTKLFKALSDINRLRILKALQSRILCACEIRELLGLANSTVSQHLDVLKDAGFIIDQKDGRWVNYMINPRPNDVRINSVLSSLDFWINDENLVIKDKKTITVLDRNIICST
jgi:ArsR family transcriptional regulator, arsenate/arsenite/antimonite-responsive transcriptional repressor